MNLEKANRDQKQKEFLELYEPSRESLVRFARSMSRNNEDAKDLVQDTILTAFDKFQNLKNHQAFTSFLFTIASRIHKRKTWRKRLFANFIDTESKDYIFDNLVSKDSNPENLADIEALYIALDFLPPKQKEAVVLFEIIGLSMEEISEIQGGSISGVKSRVQRGRKALEDLLVKERKVVSQTELEKRSKIVQKKMHSSYEYDSLIDLNFFEPEVLHEFKY